MVESSKILTVSYGTFSCTLEGFDDSFSTMKAIAEYFRDLAADDRYFGAEPPTPDAQMLAKIAEREITRRVEATTEDGGIVLRARQAPAPAMPPQIARPDSVQPAVKADMDHGFDTAQPDTPAVDAKPVAPRVASAPVSDAVDATQSVHPDAQSVAAKLQRIRAVVGKPAAPTTTIYTEDQPDTKLPDIPDIPQLDDTDDELDTQPVDTEMQSVADFIKADKNPEPSVTPADDNPETKTAPESVVAPVIEDENDDDALLSSLSAKIIPATIKPDAPATDMNSDATIQDADKPAADPAPIVHAQVLRLRKSDQTKETIDPVDDNPSQNTVSENHPSDGTIPEDKTSDEHGAGLDTDETDDFDDSHDTHVSNVAKLDGFDDLEGFEDAIPTSLSDSQEAELMNELAEVERAYAAQPETSVPTAKPRNSLPDTDDATMSHILDQTDQQLNEPEGSRRRNAIAQLKAAVAATEAARQLGDKAAPDDQAEDAFRDDLNDVVRPRRPDRAEVPAARTVRPKPAPLKLVASQRVDRPAPSNDENVAPRRVAATAPHVTADAANSFAEFAQNMGASALPDLLEAAAAYTAFVEGSEDFSRPQIMKTVQAGAGLDFSREDGLRSFGTLLREGRISKVRNGRFQVSDETRFRPVTKAS